MNVTIHSSQIVGTVKPMHACGGGPKIGGPALKTDVSDIYREIGIPSCRLHDIEYPYGQDQFIDVHCIFPNFDADETDEANYNFKATDKYLLAIKNCGADVFYRLGESIDHFEKKLYVYPPKDFAKWARICEHIIRHYNQGWADGHFMDITYWEIWNEPVSDSQWRGTYTEFYEFYTVVSKHLKAQFPNLKIGGYSCVGFYEKTRERGKNYVSPFFDSVIPFMNGFFDYIKDKDVPLDFFSWHCYTVSPEEVDAAARFIRSYLDERGYTKAESLLTELNMFYSFDHKRLYQRTEFPSDYLGVMISAQYAPMDMAFFYDLRLNHFNAMFYKDGLDNSIHILPGFYAMKFFGNVYRLKNQIKVDYEKEQGIYALGACDGEKTGLVISATFFEGPLSISLSAAKVKIISMHGHDPIEEKELETDNGVITLDVKKETIFYLEF